MAGDNNDREERSTAQRVIPWIAPSIGIIGGIAASAAGAPMVGVPMLTAGLAGGAVVAEKEFGGGSTPKPTPPIVEGRSDEAMRKAVDKLRDVRRILVEGGNPLTEGARQQAIGILGGLIDEADRVPPSTK